MRPGRHSHTTPRPLPWLSGLLLAYLVLPVVYFLARSASHPGQGFSQPGLWPAFATSAEAATISTTLVTFFGAPLAYLLARGKGRAAAVAGAAVQLPLALPPLMSGVILLYLFGPTAWLGRLAGGRFTESVTGIVLAQSFVAAPFMVITARSAFAALSPNLEEVAATAGLGPLRRFLGVAVPLAANGLRAGMLLTWLRAFGEYGATVMMSYYPLSLPVFTYVRFASTGLPATQAPALLALGLAAVVTALSRLPLRAAFGGTAPDQVGTGGLPPHLPSGGSSTWKDRGAPVRVASPSMGPVPVGLKLSLSAGAFHLQLEHRAGSHRLAVLGPSGAGKSLTLRAIAGLLPGEVTFGTVPVGHLPAERRQVGYLPQGQSLLPDRSAWANAMLGRYADPGAAAYWFTAMEIAGQARQRPGELSGGQGQRVALARALSCRPRVVLLDEPFTGLDAPVRAGLVKELRRWQQEADLSTVLVTHDFREAALLAEEILVISDGTRLQAGAPREVYENPASPAVARLLGYRNVLPGVAGQAASVQANGALIGVTGLPVPPGSPLTWSVRPERLEVTPVRRPGALPAIVLDVADVGAAQLLTLQLRPGPVLEAELPETDRRRRGPLRLGSECWVVVPPEAVLVWPSTP